MPATGSELSRRTFVLAAAASAAAACATPAGPGSAEDAAPAVRVAAVGGLALCGVWPLLAAQAGQDLGLRVQTVAASPKEGVLPPFAQGQAEVLLIHASDEAMGLEAAGLAGPARVWAWNEQVILGPRADPAQVAQARDGLDAMRRIAQAQAPFIAFRDPGSYTVVQRLWRRAGIRADAAWVRMDTAPTPQAVLRQASEQQAYVVAGHIPWAFGKMAAPGLQLLLRGDPHMRRPYVALTPGPRHGASTSARHHAQRLAEYLVSPTGQAALQVADRKAGGPWLFARDSVPFVAGEHMTKNVQAARLAAIVHADDFAGADALLTAFAQSLQQGGWRVGGVVHERRTNAQGRKGMFLADIATGREFCISQDLGPLSRGCCIDPAGVAQASAVLRQALADGVDLAIVNRFGALEAQGGGFAAEMLALAQAGIPFVTAVADKHFAAWQAFTGGGAVLLPPNLQSLCDWSTHLKQEAA